MLEILKKHFWNILFLLQFNGVSSVIKCLSCFIICHFSAFPVGIGAVPPSQPNAWNNGMFGVITIDVWNNLYSFSLYSLVMHTIFGDFFFIFNDSVFTIGFFKCSFAKVVESFIFLSAYIYVHISFLLIFFLWHQHKIPPHPFQF